MKPSVGKMVDMGADTLINALGGDSEAAHWKTATGVVSGVAAAYAGDPSGIAHGVSEAAGGAKGFVDDQDSDLYKALSVGESGGAVASSALGGDIGGAIGGLGNVMSDINSFSDKGVDTKDMAQSTAVGNVPNAVNPQYAGNGNGVNNSLNPAFGQPSISQKTQNVVKTQMSSDDQAKTMLNIA